MNWKLLVGKSLAKIESYLVHSNSSPIIQKHYPFGRNWIFDIKRRHPGKYVNIIDAGANLGYVSLALNKYFQEARIFAFEPIKDTYASLVNNTKDFKEIIPFQQALAEENKNVEILLSREHTVNSLNSVASALDTQTEIVECVSLDEFCLENEIEEINILKIDVEGYEMNVLAGAERLLKKGSIKIIYLEVGFEREPHKVHFSDVESFMEKNGFQLCGIYEITHNWFDKGKLWYSNFLYIHHSLLN